MNSLYLKALRTFGTVAVLLLAGCNRSSQAKSAESEERPPSHVTAAVAIAKDVPVYIDEIGRMASIASVAVQPQVDGRLEAVHFVEGAMVKQGDLLYTIDPRPFQAELDKAAALLAQAQENQRLAELDWTRVEKLQGTNALAQTDIDQKRSAAAVAAAQVRVAQAAVESAKLNLEYCTIESPITGRAGQRLIDPGNIVNANESRLVVVQAMDPIYADFTVPENDFGTARKYIAEGALAAPTFSGSPSSTNPLKVQVEVPADSAKVMAALGMTAPAPEAPSTQPSARPEVREGVLTFLDNSVQDNTGTLKLRATVPNQDFYFWPGQFVRIRVILTTKKDAVLVPYQAIQIGQDGPFVYLVKPESTGGGTIAELRPVTQGQRQGELVVIEHGVDKGDQVIVTGQSLIAPGAKVQVVAPATAPS